MSKRHNVKAHITGNIWKITTTVGAEVSEGDTLVIMESMKMEMPVERNFHQDERDKSARR